MNSENTNSKRQPAQIYIQNRDKCHIQGKIPEFLRLKHLQMIWNSDIQDHLAL